MNILIHMGDSYPDEGPAAKRMRVFYDVWTRLGHNVTVMAPKYEKNPPPYGNTIYCPTVKMKKKTAMLRMLNQLSFACTSLIYSHKAGKADIVLTTSPPALISISGWIIAKAKGAKLVYDVRDIWPDVAWEMGEFGQDSFYSRIFAFVRDFMLKRSDLITTVSPGKVEKLKGYAPQKNVSLASNGLDEAFLENSYNPEIAEKYGLNEGFNCVYIGNLGLAQGLTQMLRLAEKAAKEHLLVRFVLFGGGAQEDMLHRYVEEHGLSNVVFAGRIPNKEIFTVLSCAQMVFVPLVNSNLKDSIPTKLYESLGVGCPVLLAAEGDSAELVKDCKLGVAVSPNDDEGLWNALLDLYNNREAYMAHKEYSRNRILTRYSRQKTAEILEKELKKLLK